MATDSSDGLVDRKSELQELYGRRAELDKLIFINGLRILAPLLADIDLTAEFVLRLATPDNIKRMGGKAHEIATFLSLLGLEEAQGVAPGPAASAKSAAAEEVAAPAAETLEPLADAEAREPESPAAVTVAAPQEEAPEAVTASEESSKPSFTPFVEGVLARTYGEDWREVLDGLSLEDIATKMLEHEKIRLPNTPERAFAIALGVLRGDSFEVIASSLPKTTASAASQYFYKMTGRAAALFADPEAVAEPQPESATSESEELPPTEEESIESTERELSHETLAFLARFVEGDLSGLKAEDLETIVQAVIWAKTKEIEAGKVQTGRRPRTDMDDIVTAAVRGISRDALAKTYGPSKGAINQLLSGVVGNIIERNGGKLTVEGLLGYERSDVLPTIPTAEPEAEVITSPVVEVPTPEVAVEEVPVLVVRQPVSVEERHRILQQSLEQPKFVTPGEWLEFAEIELVESAQQAGFTEAQAKALWDRLHFPEDGREHARLDEVSRAAIDRLQVLFVHNSPRLKGRDKEIISMRAVTNTSYGGGSVKAAYDALRAANYDNMTPNVAQRYAVAGALELMHD